MCIDVVEVHTFCVLHDKPHVDGFSFLMNLWNIFQSIWSMCSCTYAGKVCFA